MLKGASVLSADSHTKASEYSIYGELISLTTCHSLQAKHWHYYCLLACSVYLVRPLTHPDEEEGLLWFICAAVKNLK